MSSGKIEPPGGSAGSSRREPTGLHIHERLTEEKTRQSVPCTQSLVDEVTAREASSLGTSSLQTDTCARASSCTTVGLPQSGLSPSMRNFSNTSTINCYSPQSTARMTTQCATGRLTTQQSSGVRVVNLSEKTLGRPSEERFEPIGLTTSQNSLLLLSRNSNCSRLSNVTLGKSAHSTPDHSSSEPDFRFSSNSLANSSRIFNSLIPKATSPTSRQEDFPNTTWQSQARTRVVLLVVWFLFIMVLGSCIGLVSVLFHWLVHEMSLLFEPKVCPNSTAGTENSAYCADWHGSTSTGWYLAWKIVSVIVVAEATCYFSTVYMPEIHGGGILPVKVCLAVGASVPFRVGVMRFVISSVYLGFGNPLGAETPTLHYACAVACSLYSLAHWLCGTKYFPEDNKTSMVMMGCVCGMAAAFNSVLAGMVYHVEHFSHCSGFMIQRLMGFYTMMACLMSCIVVRLMASMLTMGVNIRLKDDQQIIKMGTTHDVDSLYWVLLAIFSGFFFGLVSHAFLLFTARLRALLSRKVSEEYHGLVSGIVTSIVACSCFYVTRLDGVWGVGWDSLARILTFENEILHRVIFLFAKFFACCFAVACGGNGGIFGPALVIGGAAGSVLSDVFFFLGAESVPYRVMPVLGMCGVFAGIHRLPLTAIIVCYEFVDLGGTKDNLIFLMLGVSFMSELVASELCELDIFGVMMLQDGVNPQSFVGCTMARVSHIDPGKIEAQRHADINDPFGHSNENVYMKRFSIQSDRRLSSSSSRGSNVSRQVDLLRCVAIRNERSAGPSRSTSSPCAESERPAKPALRHANSSEVLGGTANFFGAHATTRRRRSSTVYTHVDDCLMRLGLIIPPNIEERNEELCDTEPSWSKTMANKDDAVVDKEVSAESNIGKIHDGKVEGDDEHGGIPPRSLPMGLLPHQNPTEHGSHSPTTPVNAWSNVSQNATSSALID